MNSFSHVTCLHHVQLSGQGLKREEFVLNRTDCKSQCLRWDEISLKESQNSLLPKWVLFLRIKLCDSQLSKFSFRCFVVFFWWWFVEFVLLEQKHVSHREEPQSHALRDCGSQQPLLNSDSSCCLEAGPSDSARESSPHWTPSLLDVYTGSLGSLTSLSHNYIQLQEKHLPQTSEPGELCSYNGYYGLSLSLGISHFSVMCLLQFQ